MPRSLLAAALALAAVAAPRSAHAQACTTSWAAAQSGSWSDDANWTDGAPNAGDTACIIEAGTYTVTLDRGQALAGLIVGGSSGTQTLVLSGTLAPLGEGTIGPNGVVQIEDSNNCGTCDGLPDVTGTLTVEGTLVHRNAVGLLSDGGTVDIAPGGTLRVRTGINSVNIGRATGELSRIIVRGTLSFDPEGQAPRSVRLVGDLDLAGGTISLPNGRVDIASRGRWTGGTFDVGAGGYLWFNNGQFTTRAFTISGAYTGTPSGRVSFSSGAVLAAAPGGATLDVGGAGIEVDPGSGQATAFRSAGGQLLNTGRIQVRGNGLTVAEGVVRNEGRIEFNSALLVRQGGVIGNAPGGTLEFIGSARVFDEDGTGRIVNEGLVSRSGGGATTLAAYQGRAGSEIRVPSGSRLDLVGSGESMLPAGAVATGTGQVEVPQGRFVQGAISPGTDAEPIGTLFWRYPYFASGFGDARLVIDVGEGGASDVLRAIEIPGSVELGGTLVVRVAAGYTPEVGDAFTVLTAGNAAGAISGRFDLVVAEGAPDGIAFVAEPNANRSALTVRAVERAGGAVVVSAAELVGGGERRLFVTGPGAGGVTGARLECTSCLDAQGHGAVGGSLDGSATLREVRFDLTSPRAFGYYDLVLSRAGRPDTTLALTVRPFLSIALVRESVLSGAGVRPDKGNPSYLELLVNGNSAFASYPFYAVDQPEPLVEWSVDSAERLSGFGERVFEGDLAGRDLTYFVAAVSPQRDLPVVLAQRIDPADVLFPEQTPSGPDDARVPFGEGFVVRYASSNSMTLERMAAAVEAGLRATPELATFLAGVDAGDPGAVAQTTADVLRSRGDYLAAPREVLALVLGELGAPAALIASAEGGFFDALDVAGGTAIAEIGQATSDAVNAAPADVRALFLDEVAALAGAFGDGVAPGDLAASLTQSRPATPEAGRRVTGTVGDIPIPPSPFGGNCGRWGNAGTSLTGSNIRAAGGMNAGSSGGSSGSGAGSGACGPYDPNDKTTTTPYACDFGTVVVDGEEVPRCVRYYVPLADAQDVIPYHIAFENQASAGAAAEFVTITDVLDPSLDPSTLEVYGTSSDSTFTYTVEGQAVTFRFTGIDLPPNANPPEGEGFVSFGVRPRAGLAAGTEIRNEAGIVFDFNPPIQTPAVVHELRETADLAVVLDAPRQAEIGAPVAFDVLAGHAGGDPVAEATLTVSAGTPVASASPSAGACDGVGTPTLTCTLAGLAAGDAVTVSVVLDPPPQGVYTLAASVASAAFDGYAANDTDAASLGVVAVSAEDDGGAFPRELRLAASRPNPVRSAATIRWGLPTAAAVDLRVYDLRGREVAVLAAGEPAEAGWHETTWRPDVAAGVYLVRLAAGAEARTRKVLVVR